jgi:hypothetical protein
MHQVVDEGIHRSHGVLPCAGHLADARPLGNLTLLADALTDPFQFFDKSLVDRDKFVELIGDLPVHPCQPHGHPHREISFAQTGKRVGELTFIESGRQGDQRDHNGECF